VFRIRIILIADPDPGFYLNANPDPGSGFRILYPEQGSVLSKIKNKNKNSSFSYTFLVFLNYNTKELMQNLNLVNSYKLGHEINKKIEFFYFLCYFKATGSGSGNRISNTDPDPGWPS